VRGQLAQFQTVRIGDLGSVITGKTPPSVRPELFGQNYPFLTPTDIDGYARYIDPERFLSQEGHDYQQRLLLPPHSVCVVCIGATIGKVCMTSRPSFTNQQINSVAVNQSQHDPFFVYHLLTTLKDELKANAGGAATPIINKTAFSDIEVKVPPLPIQRRIAGILSAYDDLIENNQRRIKILEQMARSLYREWFVQFKFTGHEKVKRVRSPLGMIPEGWEVKKLKDVCRLTMGQSPKSEFYNETGEGQVFHQGVTDFGERFPTDRLFCTVEGRIAEAGDILFSVRAPVGRMNIANKKIIIGRGLSAIRHNDGHQVFLWEQLRNHFTKDDMMGNGAIFAAVTKDDMQGIEILCPPEQLIVSAEKHFLPLHGQIGNLTIQTKNLLETRDLLLPRLLSGQVNIEKS
jgi:type I restriction enzyme S subunit